MLSYRINGAIVEITLSASYALVDLRVLFKTIRDDPALDSRALLLFDARARTEGIVDDDIRVRVGTLIDILRPSMAPAVAIVLASVMAPTAHRVQREASLAGLQIALFDQMDAARRWLMAYAPQD